jgi:zona occludens toxin
MAIYFHTGKPGSGKTQRTIDEVLNNKHFQNRPVYYHDIPDLKLDWKKLEKAEDWVDCPDNSVIILDEAHANFRRLDPKIKKPPHYEKFSTHRHHGLDIILITQAPKDVDKYIRDRVSWHYHLKNNLGGNKSNLYLWNEVRDPENKMDVAQAMERTTYKFKPEIWEHYRSATVHSKERKIPTILKVFPIIIILFLTAGYFALDFFTTYGQPDAVENIDPDRQLLSIQDSVTRSRNDNNVTASRIGNGLLSPGDNQTLEEYLYKWNPMIAGQPWTAPIYEELRQPVSYPRPHCLEGRIDGIYRCRCYTQQASLMQIKEETCKGIIEYGVFDPSIPDQYLTEPEKEYVKNREYERNSQQQYAYVDRDVTTGKGYEAEIKKTQTDQKKRYREFLIQIDRFRNSFGE